jgi:HlyD family secretion protein
VKRLFAFFFVAGAVLFAVMYFARPTRGDSKDERAKPVSSSSASSATIVAAGRVEPASEEIKIGSELDGKLQSVPVEEGDKVRKGQVVAVLVNGDYAARVALAEATVRERQADLDRVNNGSRSQEKRESEASVREAEAVLVNAETERRRRASLLDRGAISRTEFDMADREYLVARARVEAARERAGLIQEGSRVEDRRRAEAELERAKAQLSEAQALLAKTYIRSPIDGVVLRRKLKTGESVSGNGDTPVVTLGDTRRLRIRADVDETDVARLSIGQAAYVTAAAYGDRRFSGKVVRIGEILGRKNVRTDEPSERVDSKILETLIELDAGQTLPIGLRVDTYLEAGGRL